MHQKSSVIILVLLSFIAPLSALYVGNPSGTGIIDEGIFSSGSSILGVKTGYQGDLVFGRKLGAFDSSSGDVHRFHSYSNQGVLTLNAMNRLELFGSLGEMRIKMTHQGRDYNTESRLLWGVGARALLLSWRNVALGASGVYQESNLLLEATSGKLCYEEWQVGVGLSYQIGFFIPYIAGSYSEMMGRLEGLSRRISPYHRFVVQNRERWGMAFGATLSPGKWFDVTLEGRVLSEEAVTLCVNIKW